ncbi:MAG TPA: hypothetical protein VGD77_02265 [Gemmatimonadaceae bacterium]
MRDARGAAVDEGVRAERGSGAIGLLLRDAIDYAGLFPPAALAMPQAVEQYARYLRSDDRWALGRFVVQATRLDELAAAAAHITLRAGEPGAHWRVSALLGDAAAELPMVAAFNDRRGVEVPGTPGDARVDSVELKAATTAGVAAAGRAIPRDLAAYVEIPLLGAGDQRPLVAAIADAGLRAKVRTGGVTPEAFPSPTEVARFIAACVELAVPFKATAGLHHPLRAEYRLTYAPDSPRGAMFGFLNVFAATALLREGGSIAEAAGLLGEADPHALQVTADAICWRGHRWGSDAIAGMRAQLAGFGSCSFREPLDDLTALGLL